MPDGLVSTMHIPPTSAPTCTITSISTVAQTTGAIKGPLSVNTISIHRAIMATIGAFINILIAARSRESRRTDTTVTFNGVSSLTSAVLYTSTIATRTLRSLIRESRTRDQIFWIQYVIGVAHLAQVLVVIVQRSHVKRQTIWLGETPNVADVFFCCVDCYNHVIS